MQNRYGGQSHTDTTTFPTRCISEVAPMATCKDMPQRNDSECLDSNNRQLCLPAWACTTAVQHANPRNPNSSQHTGECGSVQTQPAPQQ
jgi:hypothetical protein